MIATARAQLTRRRLIVGLWIVVTALAVAVVLGATNVFHHGNSRRSAVAAYIDRVNIPEQQAESRLERLAGAYRAVSTGKPSVKAVAEFDAAARSLRALERRLAAIPAPRDAAKLRVLVLELLRHEISLTEEWRRSAAFLPSFRTVNAEATAANRRLARELAASAVPKPKTISGTAAKISSERAAYAAQATRAALAQADAVDSFDATLRDVAARARRLRSPDALKPVQQTAVRTFEATVAAGSRLAAQLRRPDRSSVPKLSRELAQAARLSASIPTQRAEIAAIRAYNARVQALGRLETRIRGELGRLQRTLP